MKKGTKITVSEKAKYNGQDMKWTERMERGTVEAGTILFHTSDSVIKSFLNKQTCFFNENIGGEGNVYAIKINTNRPCHTDGREVRIVLSSEDELVYIGTRKYEKIDKNQDFSYNNKKLVDRTINL